MNWWGGQRPQGTAWCWAPPEKQTFSCVQHLCSALTAHLESSVSTESSAHRVCLIRCRQLGVVGGEGDEARAQVDQTADLQVGVGAAGGGGADGVGRTHHVAVTPLKAAVRQAGRIHEYK